MLGSTFLLLLKGFCAGEYVFVIIKGFLCWGVRFCYY